MAGIHVLPLYLYFWKYHPPGTFLDKIQPLLIAVIVVLAAGRLLGLLIEVHACNCWEGDNCWEGNQGRRRRKKKKRLVGGGGGGGRGWRAGRRRKEKRLVGGGGGEEEKAGEDVTGKEKRLGGGGGEEEKAGW